MSARKTNSPPDENIQSALSLDYEPQRIRQYYERWAGTYDRDVHSEDYVAPHFIAQYLRSLADHKGLVLDLLDPTVQILDAGCGTGLVGEALSGLGYRQIDGFDLSPAMAELARRRGVYRTLLAPCDMNLPLLLPSAQYKVCVCCGVFTTGHVRPSALVELVRVTQPGGLLVVSSRKSYCESSGFGETLLALVEDGKLTQLDCQQGPYLAEEGAQYWALRVE